MGVRSGFLRELVYECGKDPDPLSRLFELARAKEGATQDGVRIWVLSPVEVLSDGECDGRLAGACLAGQPEDRRAVR